MDPNNQVPQPPANQPLPSPQPPTPSLSVAPVHPVTAPMVGVPEQMPITTLPLPPTQTTPAPVATAAAVLQSGATYEPNMFKWQPKFPGLLQWDAQGINFTDQAGARLLDLPINTITSISQQAVYLTIKTTDGKRYSFNFGGSGVATAGALLGGLVGMAVMNNVTQKSGIENWVLEARKYPHIKSGRTGKEGWELTLKITAVGAAILLLIAILF